MRLCSRWLKIAAVLVVLIGCVLLSLLPTIDPRFVGTWESYDLKDGELLWFSRGPVPKCIFRDDGSGFTADANYQTSIDLTWYIDSRKRFVWNLNSGPNSRFQNMAARVRAIFGGEPNAGLQTWKIREISNDEIVLDSVNRVGIEMVLKRISRSTEIP